MATLIRGFEDAELYSDEVRVEVADEGLILLTVTDESGNVSTVSLNEPEVDELFEAIREALEVSFDVAAGERDEN